MRRRALFLVNRKSRRGRENHDLIRERLKSGGLELIEREVKHGDLSGAIQHHSREADLIILGGGDGTINRALKGLLVRKLPVGVLPLGTANDLAHTLGLPVDPLAACDVILNGETQQIDVGRVNQQPFLNVASVGLAVEVTRRLTYGAKSRWGVLAYAWAAIGALLRGRHFDVEICCDGQSLRARTWQITVGNGRFYGGGMTIHEHARIDDGVLDLFSLEVERSWQIVSLIPALRRGRLDPIQTVRTMHGTNIEVRPIGRSRTITADGEFIGKTPARFDLLPKALTVFVPVNSYDAVE